MWERVRGAVLSFFHYVTPSPVGNEELFPLQGRGLVRGGIENICIFSKCISGIFKIS